jgi:hypothetical protein
VLSAFPATKSTWPSFHLGITPLIFRRDYDAADLAQETLSILSLAATVRVAPNVYVPRAPRLCIGIYGAESACGFAVIGRVEPRTLYAEPLTSEVGDGSAGAFPRGGALDVSLGREAVVAWRRVHDAEAFAQEVALANRRFEEMVATSRKPRTTPGRRGRPSSEGGDP